MRYLSLYWKIQSANVKSRLMYPFNFFLGFFSVMSIGVFSTLIVWVLTERFYSIAGWTFYEILFMVSFTGLCYSLGLVFFIQLLEIDGVLLNGDFDRFLVRPMNTLFQLTCTRLNINGLGNVCYFLVVLILSGSQVRDWDFYSISICVLLIICGFLTSSSIHIIIATTAFRTLQSGGLFSIKATIYENVSNYPLTVFSKPIQFLLTFILPIGFIGFYPSVALLDSQQQWLGSNVLAVCILFAIALPLLSYYLWHRAIKNYMSSGS